MPVELSEKELADLRAKAEAADKAAEREAELQKKQKEYEEKLAAAQQKYDADMKQVAAYLQSQAQPAQPKPEEEDPDAIVSRKDLKKAQQEAEARAAQTSEQHAQLLLRNQRNINKELARQRLGAKFDKYLPEIEEHLNRLNPAVAAQPTAYDEVFKYVRSAHFDEEIEEARKAREEESQGGEAEEGNFPSPPSRPIPRTESVSPSSSVNAPRPIARAQTQKPRLTDEQRRVAAGFGMTDEEYGGEYATDQPMIDNDWMGMKGRRRV